MAIVCPAVLASTPEDFLADLERVKAFAKRIQIDISDGKFTDNQTVNLSQISWPDDAIIDLHLMVHQPAKLEHDLVALGPNLVIIHAEADESTSGDNAKLLYELSQVGIKTGLAFLPKSQPVDYTELIKQIDHALVFTGHIGHYGGDFDATQLPKISQIKAINSEIEVGVDGGITAENAAKILSAGADVLNVGGFIQKADDPRSAYATIEQIVNK